MKGEGGGEHIPKARKPGSRRSRLLNQSGSTPAPESARGKGTGGGRNAGARKFLNSTERFETYELCKCMSDMAFV